MNADLESWVRSEFRRRTKAVEEGTADLDWVIPEYRIRVTEVVAKAEELGIKTNPVDLRLWLLSLKM